MNKFIFVQLTTVSFTVKNEDAAKSFPRQEQLLTRPEVKKLCCYILRERRTSSSMQQDGGCWCMVGHCKRGLSQLDHRKRDLTETNVPWAGPSPSDGSVRSLFGL